MATGNIVVANLVPGTSVNYYVAGAGSGAQAFGSGILGNPSSGTYEAKVPVSGYELYAVTFYPVGYPQKTGEVSVNDIAVEGFEPVKVALAMTVI